MRKLLILITTSIILACCSNSNSDGNLHVLRLKTHPIEVLLTLPPEFDTTFTYVSQSDEGCNSNTVLIASKKYNPIPDSGYITIEFPDSTFQITLSYYDTTINSLCFYDEPVEESINNIAQYNNANGSVTQIIDKGTMEKELKEIGFITYKSKRNHLVNHSTYIFINTGTSSAVLHFNHLGLQTEKFIKTSQRIVENLEIRRIESEH